MTPKRRRLYGWTICRLRKTHDDLYSWPEHIMSSDIDPLDGVSVVVAHWYCPDCGDLRKVVVACDPAKPVFTPIYRRPRYYDYANNPVNKDGSAWTGDRDWKEGR